MKLLKYPFTWDEIAKISFLYGMFYGGGEKKGVNLTLLFKYSISYFNIKSSKRLNLVFKPTSTYITTNEPNNILDQNNFVNDI
jgi:hypothetical protein